MSAQQSPQETEDFELAQATAAVDEDLLLEVDDLLAEIDGVLEENAEEFVRGFIQKGGQ
ncbi:ubiquitin-like protein Pup [Rothia sp. ZJ932]|nr:MULTISPECIES: ubiquitin-like protein Pup [unclassified Rothia (in: high G+C Gram-positive bacteria)]MBM7050560.1 ubiquitin-like protein Pup [Rothia sp. ZJ1223]QRZ62592.1 ubiquitin-like protein Pup [Rothia sp. ZJ932]